MTVLTSFLALLLCGAEGFRFASSTKLPQSKLSALAAPFETGLGTTDATLKAGIANFYDETSGIWLDVWGEDMHHGYYPTPDFKDHKMAQTMMIEESLKWGFGVPSLAPGFMHNKKMLDVGCGVGGSSRYIVHKYGGSACGLSLSPYQVGRANELSSKINLGDKLSYQVADAMAMPFPDNSFDLTWSMESGEHMPDKAQFLRELHRVTKPGGRIIIVTWCHREASTSSAPPLARWEAKLLSRISKAYFLPDWVPASAYVSLAKALQLEDVREDDWSTYVAPFWPAVIRSALRPGNFFKMLLSGRTTIKGALASWWMRRGLQTGVIKFALITGKKKL